MGYWDVRILGCWNIGCRILENWDIIILKFWHTGCIDTRILERWNTGMLEYWIIEALEYWVDSISDY